MRKMLVLAAALLAAAPLVASAAESMSYTYVEGGWTQQQISVPGSNPKLDGGYIRGSFAIADQVNVFGGYSSTSKTYRLEDAVGEYRIKNTIDQPELGIGYHMPMTDRLDFTADLAWTRINNEAKYDDGVYSETVKVHSNAARGALGLRGKPSRATEAWVKAGYLDGSDMDGVWIGTLGGQVSFNRNWGIVGEVQYYDDVTQYSVGVRASF
ncbi:outer membrane beta-barrel protein [uncultured Stenotrophomonas sp.]|uniref:outer membrane beta-barrel protein n=1 Tax=uncultured Stenotrophomonas sp. TaxID=165438 RepID=UPI0028D06F15|nr:outer membrane beta-barrel protein [uncultured Stenotrophomonas sp.]